MLRRTLAALQQQTLPTGRWEFLLIDNCSLRPLSEEFNLSWHPRARIIRENELGLTPARLRGIAESTGALVVFIDDDNVLDPDYLAEALQQAEKWPRIGAFGGSCRGEFESPPSPTVLPYVSSLAVSEIDREHWSNAYEWSLATPYGAGMCIRREVADEYARHVISDDLLRKTDRRGTVLTSGGDQDIVWVALRLGYGAARFPSLRLTHVIPNSRLTEDYMIRLHAGFAYSAVLLCAHREQTGMVNRPRRRVLIKQYAKAYLQPSRFKRKLALAELRARKAAHDFLRDRALERVQGITVPAVTCPDGS